jgi:hypothetical protein
VPHQVNTARAICDDMRSRGIVVHEEPKWETRGSSSFSPRGVVVHHTANGPGDFPSLRIVRDGRSDLPGPLAQWGLGRSGDVWLIAAGRANHAGRGGRRGLVGNSSVWGIEAESTGRGDWTEEQRRTYPMLVAAICRHQPCGPEMVCGHREWTTRKPDPAGIDMDEFRAEVARHLAGQEDDVTVDELRAELGPVRDELAGLKGRLASIEKRLGSEPESGQLGEEVDNLRRDMRKIGEKLGFEAES